MKFFYVIFVATLVTIAAASPAGNTGKELENAEAEGNNAGLGAPSDLTRLRKSAYGAPASGGYGAASIPAPPCPKNYLFSCQPNLAPVPCAPASSGGYGSSGAYSAPVPTYITPNNYYQGYAAPQPYIYQL